MDAKKKQRYLIRIHVEQYVEAESYRAAAASTMSDLTGDAGRPVAFRQCCICSSEVTRAGNIRKGDRFQYFKIEDLK
jgi:hypothetical protein